MKSLLLLIIGVLFWGCSDSDNPVNSNNPFQGSYSLQTSDSSDAVLNIDDNGNITGVIIFRNCDSCQVIAVNSFTGQLENGSIKSSLVYFGNGVFPIPGYVSGVFDVSSGNGQWQITEPYNIGHFGVTWSATKK